MSEPTHPSVVPHDAPGSVRSPTGSNEFFTAAYAIAAIIGLVPVFLSPDLWIIPSVAIIVYFAMGQRRAKAEGTIFEFGDSVYYLGFTLSVGSLLASLDPFSLRGKPDPEKIFHYFGLGLLTTLIGVVLRTVVQQFYRLPSESIEIANRRVSEETNELIAELASLRGRVVVHVEAATNAYSQELIPRLSEMAANAALVTGRLENAGTAALAVEASSSKVVSAVDRLAATYDGAAKRVETGSSHFTEVLGALATQLTHVSGAIEQASRATVGGLNEVRASASGSAASLGEFALAVRPASSATTDLRAALAAVALGVSEASGALHSGIDRLKTQAGVLESTSGNIQRSAFAIDTAKLDERLSVLATQVDGLASSIGHQRELTANQVSVLGEAVAAALAASRNLHSAVREIADAMAARMEAAP